MRDSNHGFSGLATLLVVVLCLVVAAAASFGTYNWQHHKVNSLNSQVASLNNQLLTISSKLGKACQPAQSNTSCTSYAYTSQKGVSVLLYAPPKNSTVASPLAVVGEVPGNWSFEAQFPVQLKDSAGRIIAQSPAHLLGNWQTTQLVPFSVQLTYTTTETGSGTLILQKDNPSGLPANEDSVTIPVKF